MSEGDLCRALGEHSKVMVEDIPTGVALVLTPRDDARIEQVREGATSLRSALTGSNDVTLEHSTGEARCGIAALAGDGATVAVEQTEDTVRVHLTTLPGQVDKLRRDVRQLADALE